MKKAVCGFALFLAFLSIQPGGVQAGTEIVDSGTSPMPGVTAIEPAPQAGCPASCQSACPADCPVKKELESLKVEMDRLNALLAEKDALLKNKDAVLSEKEAEIKALQSDLDRLKQIPLPPEPAKSPIPSWLPWLVALLAAIVAFAIGRSSGGGKAQSGRPGN